MVVNGSDRRLLELVAAHSRVVSGQVAQASGERSEDAEELTSRLCAAGLLARERVGRDGPARFRITLAGLAAAGSRAGLPGFDPRFSHPVGVAWLWLAARAGTFGPVTGVLSGREMRAEDDAAGSETSFAVRAKAPGGAEFVHYPDVMLVVDAGRIAVELQLVVPAPGRLGAVMRAYGSDPGIVAALYLVPDVDIAGVVRSVAGSLGLSRMIHVQMTRRGQLGLAPSG